MIGGLAIFTIGIAFLIGAFLFLRHNQHPKSRAATKEVFSGGGSAHTGIRGSGDKPEHAQ